MSANDQRAKGIHMIFVLIEKDPISLRSVESPQKRTLLCTLFPRHLQVICTIYAAESRSGRVEWLT